MKSHPHTPGPWTFESAAQQQPRVCIKVAHAVVKAGNTRLADVRLATDARLIAAAPDLLAALERILQDESRRGALDAAAVEAIAKAQGRT